jgi:hypothetical protein
MESNDENNTFDDHRPGAEDLHPGLAELCEIDETTTEENNPYHWPLRMLSPLLTLEMNRFNFTKFCTFMGRLEPPYFALLMAKDARALLILAWWLGKMNENGTIWAGAYPRFNSECVAICMFLENHEDPRVLRLLEYPAAKCGYVLKHVQQEFILPPDDELLTLPGL